MSTPRRPASGVMYPDVGGTLRERTVEALADEQLGTNLHAAAASWAPPGATSGQPSAGSMVVPGPAVTGDIGASADLPFQRFDRALAFMTLEMQRNSQIEWVVAGREAAAMDCGFGWLSECADRQRAAWVDTLGPFVMLVQGGGYWDHKWRLNDLLALGLDPDRPSLGDAYFPIRGNDDYEVRYDIWSNVHYGYIGSAAGLPAWQLFSGAFGAAVLSGGVEDAADSLSIRAGIRLWVAFGPNVNPGDVHAAILETMSAYELTNAQSGVLLPRGAGDWR